jgi:hypothetical protein
MALCSVVSLLLIRFDCSNIYCPNQYDTSALNSLKVWDSGKGKVKFALCLTEHHAMKAHCGNGGI